jgi:catechol 2,3-dioxygenase-like lactoylglutathione lyase family enzyme
MIRLDHLAIPVSDVERSRGWYTTNLGLQIEFEIPQRKTVALKDDGDLTLFLFEPPGGPITPSCTLTFQVDDVDAKHLELAGRGVMFEKTPQKLMWGYGAELRDPDGYLVYLWDEKSMLEKGGG